MAERPRPLKTLKRNLATGFGRLERTAAAWFGVTLVGYPFWAIGRAIPGAQQHGVFAVFVGGSVLAVGLVCRYRPGLIERLYWFGAVTTAVFVGLGWLLWMDGGSAISSWPVAGRAAGSYVVGLLIAYLVVYRQWYAKVRARLRIAIRRRSSE